MTELLCVDLALLPPEAVTAKVIALTRQLPPAPTRLNTSDCLPHLTLAMGVMRSTDLEKANDAIKRVASSQRSTQVKVTETHSYKMPNGVVFSELTVAPSAELDRLHQEIREELGPLLTHNKVDTSMFTAPPKVAEISTGWVKHYYDEPLRPHITLGEGIATELDAAFVFQPSRLALCHLGTYCTCRKILSAVELT